MTMPLGMPRLIAKAHGVSSSHYIDFNEARDTFGGTAGLVYLYPPTSADDKWTFFSRVQRSSR